MVNLITKYAPQIQTAFKKNSLLTGRLSTEYSFTGSKTVKVIIPQTVALVDYQRSGANRYGTPTEMQDIVQEMTLTKDRGFSMTIDKGNLQEQGGLKSAGKMLALEIKERCVPESDLYGFTQLFQKAGNVVGNSTALSKSTVCERIAEGTQVLDDAEIPSDGRTLYISAKGYKYLRLSPEFLGVEALAKESLAKGQVGEFDNMAVVKVPSGRWPVYGNFLIVHKDCATFPQTLNESKLHEDPPGISGNLLEGRQIYDLFVFAAKCNGIYAEVDTSSGQGTICAAPAISNVGAITSTTSGASFFYTTDGSDPRYSDSALSGASATVSVGMVVKAYAYKAGTFPSGVTTVTITA